MLKKSLFVAAACAALIVAAYELQRTYMIDPLKGSGLNDAEIRRFRYLLSLHEYSGVNLYETTPPDPETVRTFNREYGARICRVCERIYADIDTACPYAHGPTIELTEDRLMNHVNQWEAFRRDYCRKTGLRTMTRLWSIKLNWLLKHPLEH